MPSVVLQWDNPTDTTGITGIRVYRKVGDHTSETDMATFRSGASLLDTPAVGTAGATQSYTDRFPANNVYTYGVFSLSSHGVIGGGDLADSPLYLGVSSSSSSLSSSESSKSSISSSKTQSSESSSSVSSSSSESNSSESSSSVSSSSSESNSSESSSSVSSSSINSSSSSSIVVSSRSSSSGIDLSSMQSEGVEINANTKLISGTVSDINANAISLGYPTIWNYNTSLYGYYEKIATGTFEIQGTTSSTQQWVWKTSGSSFSTAGNVYSKKLNDDCTEYVGPQICIVADQRQPSSYIIRSYKIVFMCTASDYTNYVATNHTNAYKYQWPYCYYHGTAAGWELQSGGTLDTLNGGNYYNDHLTLEETWLARGVIPFTTQC